MAGIAGLSGETMPRKFTILLSMLLITLMTAASAEWWEEASYTEWS